MGESNGRAGHCDRAYYIFVTRKLLKTREFSSRTGKFRAGRMPAAFAFRRPAAAGFDT